MARGEGIPRAAWPARRKEWTRRLEEWSASGLSQAAYCRREGLDQCTFSGWKRRLRWREKCAGASAGTEHCQTRGAARQERGQKTRSADERAPVFVPLRITGAPACASNARLEVVLRNGRVMRCESSMAPRILAAVAAALETNGVPC